MAGKPLPIAGRRESLPLDAREHGGLYDLIGRFLLQELDADGLALLRTDTVSALLEALEPGIGPYLARPWTDDDFEQAAAEYCALFVLPGGVTPCASYWISGSTEEIGHQMVAGVDQVFDSFGLAVEDLPMGNVPRDHAGLLLSLAGYLYLSDAPDAARLGQEFADTFIKPFAPAFAEALAARTESPVYRALARLLSELAAG